METEKSIEEIENLFTNFWEVENYSRVFNTVFACAEYDCMDVQAMKKYSDKAEYHVLGFVVIETDLKVSYRYATEIFDSIDFERAHETLLDARIILEHIADAIFDMYNKMCKWPTNKKAEMHYALGIDTWWYNQDDAGEPGVLIPLDGFDF